jgi:hypothetical protein
MLGQINFPDPFKRDLRLTVFLQQSVDLLLNIRHLGVAIPANVIVILDRMGDVPEPFEERFVGVDLVPVSPTFLRLEGDASEFADDNRLAAVLVALGQWELV